MYFTNAQNAFLNFGHPATVSDGTVGHVPEEIQTLTIETEGRISQDTPDRLRQELLVAWVTLCAHPTLIIAPSNTYRENAEPDASDGSTQDDGEGSEQEDDSEQDHDSEQDDDSGRDDDSGKSDFSAQSVASKHREDSGPTDDNPEKHDGSSELSDESSEEDGGYGERDEEAFKQVLQDAVRLVFTPRSMAKCIWHKEGIHDTGDGMYRSIKMEYSYTALRGIIALVCPYPACFGQLSILTRQF